MTILNNNISQDITSLDYIKATIYNSKFNNWLSNNFLTALMTKDSWKLKTVEGNMFFELVINPNISFIKAKFNIGLIHVAKEQHLDDTVNRIMDYAEKPELAAHLFSETIKSNKIVFIQLTYEMNLYQGMKLESFLNLIYDQIGMIKEDIKYILNLKVIDPSSINDKDDDDEDEEDDEEDYDNNNESSNIIHPYDYKGE